MTNGNSERLDRIERLMEAVGQRVDSNARAIEANSASIQTLVEVAGRTLRAIDELRETAEEDRVNFREFVARTDTAIASINATLASVNESIERQDMLLDYLIRHDRNRNGDQPPQ